ncbi:MAG TPA: mercury methylation corrinoid protein HgcA [Methanomassiliicoccales archaeon]|jgi:hypothetical protein
MSEIMHADYAMDRKSKKDHLTARIGYHRYSHLVKPGLYSLGSPGPESPVFVTANYTLSFDALRTSIKGIDGYIMVLDTKGINVWCAAGKGTFGTAEVINRVRETELSNVVTHRRLILPQLGAPGVSAHEVQKETGFRVDFGPVRAVDLPRYLEHGPDAEMRKVKFPLKDRIVLIPVEIVQSLIIMAVAALVLFIMGGLVPALMAITVVLSGTVLFPILLPWLPTRDFSSKGIVLGTIMALPFIANTVLTRGSDPYWITALFIVADALLIAPGVGYLALNFTGSSTFASRTGVKREIFRYIPIMVGMFIIGGILFAVAALSSFAGW